MNDRSSAPRESSKDSMKRLIGARRLLTALCFAAVVAALALVLVPAASTKGGANGLEARVVATTRGPLPPCDNDATPCTEANTVRHFIYVENENKIASSFPAGSLRSRVTFPNSFVIDSVDEEIFIDGVSTGSSRYTPPPQPGYADTFWDKFVRNSWGHWPSTVTCDPGFGSLDPCIAVGKPAVVPGESTAVFWVSWAHGTVASGESPGTYVFTFTVNGTLNGEEVHVTTTSKKIVMT